MAEKDILQNNGVYKHTFKNAVEYNGEEITEITFNFNALTGEDAMNIEDELAAESKIILTPSLSGEYLMRMAAKAADKPIGHDFFKYIPLADYNTVRSKARSFLLNAE